MQAIASTEQPSNAAVKLSNVTAAYEQNIVFADLSLDIAAGQFAGIVGPTACGKTTLLNIILGVHPASSGKIFLNAHPAGKVVPGTVGYVPQLERIDWNFPVTVEEVIAMGLYTRQRLWPWPSRTERERIHDLAYRLGVHNCLRQHIATISGGQRQRAFLARALINHPQLLVLDEPTSGVDIKTQHEVLHLLSDLNNDGMTILLTTHDLNAVASHLPWVICFNKGLVAQGRPHDIFTNDIMAKTYGIDMVIVKYEGHFLIANSTPLSFMDRRS